MTRQDHQTCRLVGVVIIFFAFGMGAGGCRDGMDKVSEKACTATADTFFGEPAEPSGACAVTTAAGGPCAVTADTILAEHAVGPDWIGDAPVCLADADIVYVDQMRWELMVMNRDGEGKRCLTCPGANVLGADFPLDYDGAAPKVHWKGGVRALPGTSVVLFSAENMHSEHRNLRNSPSIGWDNDIWALDLCTGRYSRLTQLAAGDGIQHAAIADDGAWFAYPHRYELGNALYDFGSARMVFGRIVLDGSGGVSLEERFVAQPLGEVYYEPNDIWHLGNGRYALFYVAGGGTRLDAYRYDWCADESCESKNTRLTETPELHEEFTMVSPGGDRLVWMRGPQEGLAYRADLYVSSLAAGDAQRITYFNDCERWPEHCLKGGGQLSALSWGPEGRAIFAGLWEHGLFPFATVAIHRFDLAGACGY